VIERRARIGRNRQGGAALLEAALTLSVFLMLVCGILEFSFFQLEANRAAAAARLLTRYAITNDPVCDLVSGCPEGGALVCPGGAAVGATLDAVTEGCTTDSLRSECRMLRFAQRLVPRLEAGHVRVTYACSGAGFGERPVPIPLVSVAITGVPHTVVSAGLVGFGPELTLPDATYTRLGEDLSSPRVLP
jgi:hypothetical protein